MSPYRLSPEARADIIAIWDYIAGDNPEAADIVEESIYKACRLIATSPWIGQVRKDLTPRSVRFFPIPAYPNYVIVYDPDRKPLTIVRVAHGARDIRALLR